MFLKIEVPLYKFRQFSGNFDKHCTTFSGNSGKRQVTSQCKNINLEVQDNGCGITVDQIQNLRSLGLLGMRERAMVWGGYFNIEGVSEGGTIVTINIKKDENGENEGEN